MQKMVFWQHRMFWMIASVSMGVLQAWDSGALQAGVLAQGLIAIGVLAPALAIGATGERHLWIGALIAGAALLLWARLIAPIPLNTLHLALFVPALYALFMSRMVAPARG